MKKFFKKMSSVILAMMLMSSIFIVGCSDSGAGGDLAYEEEKSVKDGYLYYTNENTIYRINTKTKENEVVKSIDKKYSFFESFVTIKDDWLYCTYNQGFDSMPVYVYRVKTNGEDGQVLAEGEQVNVVGDSIYYVKIVDSFVGDEDYIREVIITENDSYVRDIGYGKYSMTAGIYKADLDGSNETCLVEYDSGDEEYLRVEILFAENEKIYFRKDLHEGSEAYSMNLDGSNIEELSYSEVDLNTLPSDIKIYYNDYAYYAMDEEQGAVYRLLLGDDFINKISNGNIYTSEDGKLYSTNMETKEKTEIGEIENAKCMDDLKIFDNFIFVKYDDYNEYKGKVSVFDSNLENEILLGTFIIM